MVPPPMSKANSKMVLIASETGRGSSLWLFVDDVVHVGLEHGAQRRLSLHHLQFLSALGQELGHLRRTISKGIRENHL